MAPGIGRSDGAATRSPSGAAGSGGASVAGGRHRHRTLRLHADPALHERRPRPRQVGGGPDRLGQLPGLSPGRARSGLAGSAGRCALLAAGRAGGERAQHRRDDVHDEPGGVPAAPLRGWRRRRPGDGACVLAGDGPARRRRPRWLGGGDVRRRRQRHRALLPGGARGGIGRQRLASPVVLLRRALPRARGSGGGVAAKAAKAGTDSAGRSNRHEKRRPAPADRRLWPGRLRLRHHRHLRRRHGARRSRAEAGGASGLALRRADGGALGGALGLGRAALGQ